MNKQSVATGVGPELMGWPHASEPGNVVVVMRVVVVAPPLAGSSGSSR
jgi:hypothetical protein